MRQLSRDTLNQLYAETFSRINTAEYFARSTTVRTFSFLLCMQEALSSALFLPQYQGWIPSIKCYWRFDGLLLNIYFNLIIHDSELKFLRFAHVSVQEFLEIQPDLAAHRAHKLAATRLGMGLNSIIHCTASGKRDSFQVSLARTFYVHQYIINTSKGVEIAGWRKDDNYALQDAASKDHDHASIIRLIVDHCELLDISPY